MGDVIVYRNILSAESGRVQTLKLTEKILSCRKAVLQHLSPSLQHCNDITSTPNESGLLGTARWVRRPVAAATQSRGIEVSLLM